jgi:hypothetical protein
LLSPAFTRHTTPSQLASGHAYCTAGRKRGADPERGFQNVERPQFGQARAMNVMPRFLALRMNARCSRSGANVRRQAVQRILGRLAAFELTPGC